MKIRIGNDIHVMWTILKEDKPYILNDNVKVKLLDPFNKPVVCEYTIKNNIIDVIYRGKTQVTYGKYSLLLVENEDIDDMISVDAHDIFELTKRTYRNIGDNKTDVMIDVPEITSNVGVGEIYDDTQVKADIQKNADNIAANSEAIKLKADKTELANLATKEEVNAAKYDDTQVKSDIKTNADNINLKANRKDINEYNITQLFGIGCDTLQKAVNNLNNYLTEDLKITGIRIVFINLTDRIETWEYKGHGVNNVSNWEEIKKYELPIATNSVLGGVMPETKTDEMTQVVGVDAVGKLYTKDFKYDLPVANFTTLGGVKPVAKTEKMTKDVGVNAEGKLYVEIPTVAPYDDTQIKQDIQTNADNIALKADKTELTSLATKEELNLKADKTELNDLATKQEVENAKYNDTQVKADIKTNSDNIVLKQDKLVSGTNIKTINNESILGTGNITIEGGTPYDDTQVKADIKKNTDDIAALNTALNGAEATVTNINNIIG